MKKATVIVNENVAKEHLKPVINFTIFCFASAIVFFTLMIVFSILNNNWLEVSTIIFAIVGALSLFAGILFLLQYLKGINMAKRLANTVSYEFFDDHLTYVTTRGEQVIQQGTVNYQDLISYKETKNYIFLEMSDHNFLPFEKTEEILSFIKEKELPLFKSIKAVKK